MSVGTLYGIGVGPGDPEFITVKGARLLASLKHVFVPKSPKAAESLAASIATSYVSSEAQVTELTFPMTRDPVELSAGWSEAAKTLLGPLRSGQDVCFLTLGDPMMYSTFIYLVRALRREEPGLPVVTIPGITSMCAAAALGEFPLGVGDQPIFIVPAGENLDLIRQVASLPGTLVIMKIGANLPDVLDLLDELGWTEHSLFVSHAGQDHQRMITDLQSLRQESPEAGYLSIILTRGHGEES